MDHLNIFAIFDFLFIGLCGLNIIISVIYTSTAIIKVILISIINKQWNVLLWVIERMCYCFYLNGFREN